MRGANEREAMKYEDEPLVIPGEVKTFRPTGKKILESPEPVMVMTTADPNCRAFGSRFRVPRVLKLASFSRNIYLNVKERNEYLS